MIPTGGPHLWLPLPSGADPGAVAAEALRQGVAVTAGSNYYAGFNAPAHLRVSYVAAPSSADLVEGIARLGRALDGAADRIG